MTGTAKMFPKSGSEQVCAACGPKDSPSLVLHESNAQHVCDDRVLKLGVAPSGELLVHMHREVSSGTTNVDGVFDRKAVTQLLSFLIQAYPEEYAVLSDVVQHNAPDKSQDYWIVDKVWVGNNVFSEKGEEVLLPIGSELLGVGGDQSRLRLPFVLTKINRRFAGKTDQCGKCRVWFVRTQWQIPQGCEDAKFLGFVSVGGHDYVVLASSIS